MTECNIVFVGKNRNGTARYWCREHHAPAYGKNGVRLAECLAPSKEAPWDRLSVDPDAEEEVRKLILGTLVPAAYDTTAGLSEHGRPASPSRGANELAVLSCMASHTFGYGTEYLECPHCGEAHLDRDWFAVNPHKVHLCLACGRNFHVREANIGNPLVKGRAAWKEIAEKEPHFSGEKLEICQKDFPYGIAVSVPQSAFCRRFASEAAECGQGDGKEGGYGIRIQAFAGNDRRPDVEGIYEDVVIDGLKLDAEQIRLYMVQKTLPFLNGRIQALRCPVCGEVLFDKGRAGCLPELVHRCEKCDTIFRTQKKLVSNPFVETMEGLKKGENSKT